MTNDEGKKAAPKKKAATKKKSEAKRKKPSNLIVETAEPALQEVVEKKTVTDGIASKETVTTDSSPSVVPITDSVPPMANVGLSMSYTKNVGDYESLKCQVSLHIPTENVPEAWMDSFKQCKEFCEQRMGELFEEAEKVLNGGESEKAVEADWDSVPPWEDGPDVPSEADDYPSISDEETPGEQLAGIQA